MSVWSLKCWAVQNNNFKSWTAQPLHLLPRWIRTVECETRFTETSSCISKLCVCRHQISVFLGWLWWSKVFFFYQQHKTVLSVSGRYLRFCWHNLKPKHGAAGAKLWRCFQVRYHCCHQKQNPDCLFMTSLPSSLYFCQVSTHWDWLWIVASQFSLPTSAKNNTCLWAVKSSIKGQKCWWVIYLLEHSHCDSCETK